MNEKERILDALREVHFPGLGRDILSLGYVREIAKERDRWRIALEIATNHPTAVGEIEADARSRLSALDLPFELDLSSPPSQASPSAEPAPGGIDLLSQIPLKIAVASGKGGVGKSTVAVNLAVALASLGKSAGLLDCDIYGPSVPLMLGMEDERPRIEGERIVPLERYGIRSMSIGYLVDRTTPVIWRGPMVGKALEQLMIDVAWDGVEALVLDLPPGTGDAQISIAQRVALSGAVIVTTPQDVALIAAGKGAAMFGKVDVRVLGLIENMSYFACPHCGQRTDIFRGGGGRREALRLGIPLLGEIPIDPRIPVSGDLGKPVVAEAPESEAGRAFLAVARALLDALGAGASVGRS